MNIGEAGDADDGDYGDCDGDSDNEWVIAPILLLMKILADERALDKRQVATEVLSYSSNCDCLKITMTMWNISQPEA